MTTRPKTTRGEAVSRAVPWSTRAVILLAFAIQLGPASARLDSSTARPIDSLTLCDGHLLPLWFAERVATETADSEAIALTRLEGEASIPPRATTEYAQRGVALDQVGWAILPMPPPAAC